MDHVIVDGGLRVACDVRGEGDAVMLVHGLGFSRRAWSNQVDVLIEAGYRVITCDLRGFGGSDMPEKRYTMSDLAGDLEVVREASGAENIHLVGHSMGGMVCQHYALAEPERMSSLFFASTTSHNGRRGGAFARAMSMLSRRGFSAAKADPETWSKVEAILAEIVPVTGPVLHILEKLTSKPHPARAMAWDAISEFTVKDQVTTLQKRTTVIHGTADANIPYGSGRLLAEAIEGAELITIDGGQHNIPIDNAEVFNDALLRHLQREH